MSGKKKNYTRHVVTEEEESKWGKSIMLGNTENIVAILSTHI